MGYGKTIGSQHNKFATRASGLMVVATAWRLLHLVLFTFSLYRVTEYDKDILVASFSIITNMNLIFKSNIHSFKSTTKLFHLRSVLSMYAM